MKLGFQLCNCNGHCSRGKNVSYFTACNNPGLLKIYYTHTPFSQVRNRPLFYITRQLKEGNSYKGVVLFSVIMLSAQVVDFLPSSSLRHTPSHPRVLAVFIVYLWKKNEMLHGLKVI